MFSQDTQHFRTLLHSERRSALDFLTCLCQNAILPGILRVLEAVEDFVREFADVSAKPSESLVARNA